MFRRLLILCAACLVLFACEKSTEPKVTLPLPQFSPPAGTYFSAQSIHINVSQYSNVTIRYTLDGTEPSTSSAIYSAPIGITGAAVIKAKAYKSKMKPSAVASASYAFNVGTLYFNPNGGTYTVPKTVSIVPVSEGTIIHFTTDNSEPTEASPIYTVPMIIDGNTTLKARGYIAGWNPSETVSAIYGFNVTQPTFSVDEGFYYNSFEVAINTPTEDASIHYTTDGSEPTEASALYNSPITVSASKTVKAKAYKAGWNASGTASVVYTLKVTAPGFNPLPGNYTTSQTVAISCSTPEATIYYTTNGSEPTQNSDIYSSPLVISVITPLKARAFRDGWTPSNISSGNYNFNVLTPTLDPSSGQYAGEQTVTISCATEGAEIRYTTNSSDPVSTSALYISPITVATNMTLKAKGFKTGMNPSQVATAVYQITNIVATPTFNPPEGTYYEPQEITIECSTSGADIRYTLDGSEPSAGSLLYSDPLPIDTYTEIKSKAYKSGWTASQTASAIFQFDTYNQIVAWGSNTYNQCNVPPGTDFAQIEAGMYHIIGLRTDGSLVAWGRNNYGQCNYPAGNDYIAISAGDNHSLALKTDGSIVAWGRNDSLQCEIPADSLGYVYTAISAGGYHSLALRSDSTLIAWGDNSSGQCDVPEGNVFVKISAGANHNLAIRSNGTLAAWGNNDNGQINAPTGNNYVDIAAGDQHSVAKRTTGTLIAWGSNGSGQSNSPTGTTFTKIAAGYRHNLALKQDGSVLTWGYSGGGLSNVPSTTTYIDVAAGRDFSVVLKSTPEAYKRMKLKALKPRFKLK
jgi:hypothetical protein